MPGGLEETLLHIQERGKYAYKVDWTSKGSGVQRSGAASIAVSMGPGFRVVPCFVENAEVCTYACVNYMQLRCQGFSEWSRYIAYYVRICMNI